MSRADGKGRQRAVSWPLGPLVVCCLLLFALPSIARGGAPPSEAREWSHGLMPTTPVELVQEQHGTPGREPMVYAAPSIQALAVAKGRAVYAGSFGRGVFRSDDRGSSWSAMNTGLTDPFVLALAVAPDSTIYAGTLRGGVFRSRDGGRSWQTLNGGLKRLEVKALLIHGGVVYAGTGDGVYRLAEGEDRWKVVTQGLDDTLVHSIVRAADGTLFAGTSGKGVHRYKPNTPGWIRLSQGLKDHEGMVENFIRVLAVDYEQALYAGTFDGGVFLSSDGGQTWRPISRALPNDSIRGIVASEKGLFVATGRGIYASVDQGRKWTPLNTGLTELSVQVMIVSTDGSLYAGTSAGAFRSDDGGKNWIGISDGLQGPSAAPFTFR